MARDHSIICCCHHHKQFTVSACTANTGAKKTSAKHWSWFLFINHNCWQDKKTTQTWKYDLRFPNHIILSFLNTKTKEFVKYCNCFNSKNTIVPLMNVWLTWFYNSGHFLCVLFLIQSSKSFSKAHSFFPKIADIKKLN